MQTVRHDGRETAYRRTDFGNEAPPVLFVHGSGGTHEVWTAQYGRRENDYPAIAIDLSGHGESDDVDTDPGYETLDAYAADVRAVVRETGAEILVGNSLGGAVLLQLVLETDVDPTGMVLVGSGAKLAVHPDVREWLETDFEQVVEFLHGENLLFHDPDPDDVERSQDAMRAVGQRVTRRDLLSCHAFDVRDRLDDIEVPTEAIVGEYDALTPVEYHEYLSDNIRNAGMAEIADAAHLAMVEQPDAFNAALDLFRRRL